MYISISYQLSGRKSPLAAKEIANAYMFFQLTRENIYRINNDSVTGNVCHVTVVAAMKNEILCGIRDCVVRISNGGLLNRETNALTRNPFLKSWQFLSQFLCGALANQGREHSDSEHLSSVPFSSQQLSFLPSSSAKSNQYTPATRILPPDSVRCQCKLYRPP